MRAASLWRSVQVQGPRKSQATPSRTSRASVKGLFGIDNQLRWQVHQLQGQVQRLTQDVRRGFAAIEGPVARLAERAALEELRADSGAEFRNAYEVAWFLLDGKAKKQVTDDAVETLVSNVMDQDMGAQRLLSITKQQILHDTAPRPEDIVPSREAPGPVEALLTYLSGKQSPPAIEDDEITTRIKDATNFMDDIPFEPKEVLEAIQHLRDALKKRDGVNVRGWYQPYLKVLTDYYASKLKNDAKQLKEVVAENFVMLALPKALEPHVLPSPIEILEVDLLWPIEFDGFGGCEIRIGEAKSRATVAAVKEARKQLERSLLFFEWACKLVHGDSFQISLTGIVAVLKTSPIQYDWTNINSKVKFELVKI